MCTFICSAKRLKAFSCVVFLAQCPRGRVQLWVQLPKQYHNRRASAEKDYDERGQETYSECNMFLMQEDKYTDCVLQHSIQIYTVWVNHQVQYHISYQSTEWFSNLPSANLWGLNAFCDSSFILFRTQLSSWKRYWIVLSGSTLIYFGSKALRANERRHVSDQS